MHETCRPGHRAQARVPVVVGLERERGLSLIETAPIRSADSVYRSCDPSQVVTVSSILPIGFSSTRRRAPTPLVWSPMALVALRPLQWFARFGKSAYRVHPEPVDAGHVRLPICAQAWPDRSIHRPIGRQNADGDLHRHAGRHRGGRPRERVASTEPPRSPRIWCVHGRTGLERCAIPRSISARVRHPDVLPSALMCRIP